MVDPKDQPKVAAFIKQAFEIDGDVEFLDQDVAMAVVRTHRISIMRLKDSKRGSFYVATFKPKPVGKENLNS